MGQTTYRVGFLFIVILTALAVYIVWPSEPKRYLPDVVPWPSGHGIKIGSFERRAMRLGLDLQGGTYLVLEADLSQVEDPGSVDIDQALQAAVNIIERRINALGVAESEVARQGSTRIAVQIPGIEPERARELVGRTAQLEFKELRYDRDGNVIIDQGDGTFVRMSPQEAALTGLLARAQWDPARAVGSDGVEKPLTGQYLKPNAFIRFDSIGRPLVAFEFNSEGGRLFQQITRRNIGKPLGIFLDDQLISAPTVQAEISDSGVIEGIRDLQEARLLVAQLNAGALPVPLKVVQQQAVDATLGSDSVLKSVRAGEAALLLVMLFMILYYRLPGLLASGALLVYAALTLAIFKLLPVTLTLAGIAAFVLSVGMAVDANILIFERMKEELRLGRSLLAAIDAGWGRAWNSIRDSNFSTLITCLILFWFGDQFGAALIKGFALTLAIGVIVSMFTAIFATRTFLHLVIGWRWLRVPWLFGVEGRRPPVGQVRAISGGGE